MKNLGKHVHDEHGITSAAYKKEYGETVCSISHTIRSQTASNNCDWINRAKKRGDDLLVYRQKMSKSVKDAILSNPVERLRRSNLLKELNKTKIWTPEFKSMMTEKSKKTAARPEIIKRRTENLRHWRETHYDEFHEKCVKAMLNAWHSKPELALFEIVKRIDGYSFKLNQFLKSETFVNKSQRKQIDIADSKLRVYIEFDGPWHFKNINGKLEEVCRMDNLLDEHIERYGWTLIRISYEQWDGKKFNEGCLKILFEALREPKAGVTKIGNYKGKN